jgi:hypothetical protein
VVDILDALDGGEAELPQTLDPVRLSESTSLLLVFTTDGQRESLHFVDDPAVNAYVPCPGAACPLCHCGQAPTAYYLMPVVNLARRAVEVLRISTRRGPGTLAAGLLPHLRGDDLANKLFRVQRTGAKFVVEVQALGVDADRCVSVVKGFLAAREQGLSLSSAFPEYSATDLAEVPAVQRMVDAIGGWKAPEHGDAAAG